MNREEEKQVLCDRHRALLQIVMNYGNGAMLLPQARALCLALGLYPSAQAVNRAVRDLRAADVLDHQTWIDNNSDLILARKYVRRYFSCVDSQSVATPHRPGTMAPHILQARKIDWLLSVIAKESLTSMEAVEDYLKCRTCTVFLRLPDLLDFYHRNAALLAAERLDNYREQVTRMEASAAQRTTIARCASSAPPTAPQVATLEQMHRRGIYITGISRKYQAVTLALFAGRRTTAERIMDWTIDAQMWIISLLPYYHSGLTVYALDVAHREALRTALTAPAGGRITPYWHDRLIANHLDGLMQLAVTDTNFVRRWCGGIQRTDCF